MYWMDEVSVKKFTCSESFRFLWTLLLMLIFLSKIFLTSCMRFSKTKTVINFSSFIESFKNNRDSCSAVFG